MGDASGVVITGIGPMCPLGTTARELAAGQRSGGAGGEWFDPVRHLGPKGHKYFTPPTRYILAAAGQALADAGLEADAYPRAQRGVVVGTNFAAFATLEGMDRTVRGEGAEALQPMLAPSFSVNIPASQVSIKHAFQAFNVTLTSAMVAGLEAVLCGAAALRRGRARLVLAGATEDRPPAGVAELLGIPAVEGAACAVALETSEAASARGARAHARVGPGLLRFVGPRPEGAEDALGEAVERFVASAIPAGAARVAYAPQRAPFRLNQVVDGLVRRALRARGLEPVEVPAPGGDGSFATVSPLLQLAALAGAGGPGLVAAASPQGHVALRWVLEGSR